jgi:hypothetical protein
MRLKCAVWLGLGFYALLSAADWLLTYALLHSHPWAMEANPLAAACLERYGWNGLAFYKAGGVLLFVAAVFLLGRRRPALATVLVAAGCAVLLVVTTYTHGLLREAHRDAVERAQDAAWPKPQPEPTDSRAEFGFTVPERCWFAPEPAPAPTTVVSRK